MVLDPGDPAPTIEARNQDGESVAPDFEAPTVVYFYPEDGTPGCRTEAAQFELERETYQAAGVSVYGVSRDSASSHAEFADAEGLSFDLLADPDGEVARAFDVPIRDDEKAVRTTVVLANGRVHESYEDVSPDGHARTVLADLLDAGLVTLEDG